MTESSERFRHLDNNENGHLARMEEALSRYYHRQSSKRVEALNGFNRISRSLEYKYDEVNNFIHDTKGKLEEQPFFCSLQDHLTELQKRFHEIWEEVDEAEDKGGIAGGLTIGPLKEKTSQIEAIWHTLHGTFELLEKVHEDQDFIACAKTYKQINEKCLNTLERHQPVKDFLDSLREANRDSILAKNYLRNSEGDPETLWRLKWKLEESTTRLKDKYGEVREYLGARDRLEGAIEGIGQELDRASDYYMLSWTYNLGESSLDGIATLSGG